MVKRLNSHLQPAHAEKPPVGSSVSDPVQSETKHACNYQCVVMMPQTAPFPSERLLQHISDLKLFHCVEAPAKWVAVLEKLWKNWHAGKGQLLLPGVPGGTFGQPWRWERLENDRSWLTLCSQGQNSSIASFSDLALLLCHVAAVLWFLSAGTVTWWESGRCVLKMNRHNRASEFVDIDIRHFGIRDHLF